MPSHSSRLLLDPSDCPTKGDRSSSRRQWLQIAGSGICVAVCGPLFPGCQTAPITGRKQLVLVPEGQEITLGAQAFEKTVMEAERSQNTRAAEMVRRVGNRIAQVARRDDYEWQFELLASSEQNAFCLPGGKVAVYEGILPICTDEAGLAVVMSHEIAHAIARHGGERMSQNYAVEGIRQVTDLVTQAKLPDKRENILRAYGVASSVGFLLPYSRKQEMEADEIGVMLMAEAGYEPSAAPGFWTRFGQAKSGEGTPEFLSTHPSDSRRADHLRQLLPTAQQRYQLAPHKSGTGQSLPV